MNTTILQSSYSFYVCPRSSSKMY